MHLIAIGAKPVRTLSRAGNLNSDASFNVALDCFVVPLCNVRQALKEEKALVEETGQGTREWTETETKQLLEKGKVKGYPGHHINNVKHHPSQAGNPNNIKFVTPKEHLLKHGGNFKTKRQVNI